MVCWQEPGLQRLAQPPGCFGDRIPVTCHPRKICMSPSCTLFLSNMSTAAVISSRSCQYAFASIHASSRVSVWTPAFKGADVRRCLFFCPIPYFSVFCFSKRWAQMLLLIGLFTDNIIRITKMAQFWALHQTALIIQNHFSLFLISFFHFPLPSLRMGWKGAVFIRCFCCD